MNLEMSLDQVLDVVGRNDVRVVGVPFLTTYYHRARDLVRRLKDRFPDLIVVGGSAHVTLLAAETMAEIDELDFALRGEAEFEMVRLMKALTDGAGLDQVRGLVRRQGPDLVDNNGQGFVSDLDHVALPARDLLPMDVYRPTASRYKRLPAYFAIASRGCPYRCTYCCQITGRTWRMHGLDRLLEEIDILTKDYGAREILYGDDTLTINRRRLVEFCEAVIARNLRVRFSCYSRVDHVDLELLKLMKRAGFWEIGFGVESGSQRLLNEVKKGITLDQVHRVFGWCEEAGIESRAFFMLGLPTETREESRQTIRFSRELNPKWLQCTITVPYPKTELWAQAKREGLLASEDWRDYQPWGAWSGKAPAYLPAGRTADELQGLYKKMILGFYLRPKTIRRHLSSIGSTAELVKYAYAAGVVARAKLAPWLGGGRKG
jgi:radical SAM superfamily enzyme YgiQ (UPF0313 family)